MKKLLLLIVSALCPYIYMAAEGFQSPSQESHEIKLEKLPPIQGTGELGFPRSVYFLEAFYDTASREIQLIHDSLGEVTISLFDASGQIVYQDHIYSSNYSIHTIIVPSLNGQYTIVIDSQNLCAYGSIVAQ